MRKKLSKRYLSSAIAASLALVEAVPALAQIEEVKVTARKREESVLQVPVSMTAISEQVLQQNNVVDIKGIANLTPGLNLQSGVLASGVMISLRGIGTGSNNPMIDQSVALVADGMQFTQGIAFASAMFDMAQVEVLKGPQAVFFGKAAPGGVINIRTADPTSEPMVAVTAGYEFAAKEKIGELIASGPLSDTFGVRLAAKWSEMDGYFRNDAVPTAASPGSVAGLLNSFSPNPVSKYFGAAPVTHKDFPEQKNILFRGTAVWEPTDRFNARLKYNYANMDTQGTGGEPQIAACPGGTAATHDPLPIDSIFGVSLIGNEDCKADDRVNFVYMDPKYYPGIKNGGVPFMKYVQKYGTLELNYDLDNDLRLTSVTGGYALDQSALINLSLTQTVGTPIANQSDMQRYDFTQELRLTSDYSGPINFLVGAFYENGKTRYVSRLPFNQSWLTVMGVKVPGYAAHAVDFSNNHLNAETISLFGQTLWKFTDELELGVGVRWTDEERRDRVWNMSPTIGDDVVTNSPSITAIPIGPAIEAALATPKIRSKNYSPEVSLTYTPSPTMTVYGNIKQAYKSGSFDIASRDVNGEDLSYGDERVKAAELGIKSRLADNSVALNAATYYYKYTDMQVDHMDTREGVFVKTINAGSSHIYGLDFDIAYAPNQIQGLTLTASANWNKARYDEFNAPCFEGQSIAQGCNVGPLVPARPLGVNEPHYELQDLKGAPLLRAPEWVVNGGFTYDLPVADDVTLRLGSNFNYSSSYSASSTDYKYAYQDRYIKTNASIGLIGAEDRWKVELIGNNLGNEYTYGSCTPMSWPDGLLFSGGIAGTGTVKGIGNPSTACFVDRGRAVTLRLTKRLL